VIEKNGADALRFMLTTGISPGSDLKFRTDRLEAARNFANKLWNASRFVIMNLDDDDAMPVDIFQKLKDEDKWILSRVNDAVCYVTDALDKFELSIAGQKVYEVIWNEFCDWYIELIKGRLYGGDDEDKAVCRYVLVRALKDIVKMLHPFMPFITEEIWGFLPKTESSEGFLMQEPWPVYDGSLTYDWEVKRIQTAMEVIRSIRNIRAEADAAPAKKLRAFICAECDKADSIRAAEAHVRNLANISSVEYIDDKSLLLEEAMSAVIDGVEIFIPTDDLIDYRAELERLQKEKERLESETNRIGAKLTNDGFLSKAPEKIVNDEKEKLAKYKDMLVKVIERLELVEGKI